MRKTNKKTKNFLKDFFPHKHATVLMSMIIVAVGLFGYFGIYRFNDYINISKLTSVTNYLRADVIAMFQDFGVGVGFHEPLDVLTTDIPFSSETSMDPAYIAMPIYMQGQASDDLSVLTIKPEEIPTYITKVVVRGGQYLDVNPGGNISTNWGEEQPIPSSQSLLMYFGLNIPLGTNFSEPTEIGIIYFYIPSLANISMDLDFIVSSMGINGVNTNRFSPDNIVNINFEPPLMPINLIAEPIGSDSFVLSWEDGVGSPSVDGYKLFLNDLFLEETTELTYTYTGLSENEHYVVGVEAFNIAGNSDMARDEVQTKVKFTIRDVLLTGRGPNIDNNFYSIDGDLLIATVDESRPAIKYYYNWVCITGSCIGTEINHETTSNVDTLSLDGVWKGTEWKLNVSADAVIDEHQQFSESFSLVNAVPTTEDSVITLDEDGTIEDVMKASDLDRDILTYHIVDQPSKGMVSFVAPGKSRFVYEPNDDENGADFFTFKVNDGESDSEISTVNINITSINDNPQLDSIGAQTTPEDIVKTIILNATDVDGDSLTYNASSSDANVTTSINITTHELVLTSSTDWFGPSDITVEVSDGNGGVDSEIFMLTVTSVNDAPVLGGTPSTFVDAGSQYSFTPSKTDVDTGDTHTFSIINKPSWTTFDTITGSLSGIPTNADVGVYANIAISVMDDGSPVESDTMTFDIEVLSTNTAPTAVDDVYATLKNSTFYATPAGGVLKNDTDLEGDTLTAVLDTDISHGTLTLNSNGSFTYVPTISYVGQDSFTYHANDGIVDSNISTVTISINVNSPTEDMIISSITPVSTTELMVKMNYTINDTTVVPSNFIINGLTVLNTTLNADNKTVTITTSTQTEGQTYTLEVYNLLSLDGLHIVPSAGRASQFTTPSSGSLIGDCNNDGIFEISDVLISLKATTHTELITLAMITNCDIGKVDGEIDIRDVLKVYLLYKNS